MKWVNIYNRTLADNKQLTKPFNIDTSEEDLLDNWCLSNNVGWVLKGRCTSRLTSKVRLDTSGYEG